MELTPVLLSGLPVVSNDATLKALMYSSALDKAVLVASSEIGSPTSVVNNHLGSDNTYSFGKELKIFDLSISDDLIISEGATRNESHYSEVRFLLYNSLSNAVNVLVTADSLTRPAGAVFSIPALSYLELSISAYGLKRFLLSKSYE